MSNVLPKLEEIAKGKGNLAILASYLINIDTNVNNLNTQKISDDLYISIATGTRLAQKLGLSGFNELKVLLIQEKEQNKKETIKYENSSKNEYLEGLNKSLKQTSDQVEDELIRKVAKEIHNSTKVNFYAIGGSYIVLSDFAYKISRLNKNISISNDLHFQSVDAHNNSSDTLNIALSYSGNTKEILSNLKVSKQNNGKTVLITNNEYDNYEYVDYVINIHSIENTKRLYSINSRFSTLLILDFIYLSFINMDKDNCMEILENTRIIK